VTTYYHCPVCTKIYDCDEPCHYPDDLAVIHPRSDGNHWFELTNGQIDRDWLVKMETTKEPELNSPTSRWEYRVLEVVLGMDAVLNDQGLQGWELVCVTGVDLSTRCYAYMKRELK
jgi:hypothetical protein